MRLSMIYPMIFCTFLWGCNNKGEIQDAIQEQTVTFKTYDEAAELSPTADVCIFGEIEEIFVPSNRGRGNNNGEYVTVDNRVFEPAFRRMDVNYDGRLDQDDAHLATKNIYVKQIEKELCPAVADIGMFPQGFGADTWLTSEDIIQWRDAKKRGVQETHDMLADEDKLICLSECEIINHMSPDFKHQ